MSVPWEVALASITFEPKFDQESPPSKDYKFYFIKTNREKRRRRRSVENEQETKPVFLDGENSNKFQSSSVDISAPTYIENSDSSLEETLLSSSSSTTVGEERRRKKRSAHVIKEVFVPYLKKQYVASNTLGLQYKLLCKQALQDLEMSGVLIDYINGQISVDCINDVYSDLTLAMPQYMANMLGFMPSDMKPFWKGENYVSLTIEAGKLYNCPLKVDVNVNIPRNMLIYINCIDSSLIGDNFAAILKSVPVRKKQVKMKSFVTYEPRHLEFRRVNFTSIDYLHFRIQKVDGTDVDCYENMKIYMSLLFRNLKTK